MVYGIYMMIFIFQPFSERSLAQRTVAFPAVFIGNMPHDNSRMVFEGFGELLYAG